MNYSTTEVPEGSKIVMVDGALNVPNNPLIPFVEGDGIGPDIWRSSCRILDSAVALAYGDQITNMLQPFWALPLLGITGLKAKEILPYTLYLFLMGSVIFIGGLLLF